MCLHYHIVFSVKARRRDIAAEWRVRLHAYLAGAISQGGGMPVIVGGVADYVHLPRFQWQKGYGGFTVSPSRIKSVRAYIANQEQHHRTKTFQDEYLRLLDDSGIEYDKRYL